MAGPQFPGPVALTAHGTKACTCRSLTALKCLVLAVNGYRYWSGQSTEKIIQSLAPGAAEPLTVSAAGGIVDGNTRIFVLIERGIDVSNLPRVIYSGGGFL